MIDPGTNLSTASADSFQVWDAIAGAYVNLKTSIIGNAPPGPQHAPVHRGGHRQRPGLRSLGRQHHPRPGDGDLQEGPEPQPEFYRKCRWDLRGSRWPWECQQRSGRRKADFRADAERVER